MYKGLAPNILRGMAMNVGMMACYDQAKETVAGFNDMVIGSSAVSPPAKRRMVSVPA